MVTSEPDSLCARYMSMKSMRYSWSPERMRKLRGDWSSKWDMFFRTASAVPWYQSMCWGVCSAARISTKPLLKVSNL